MARIPDTLCLFDVDGTLTYPRKVRLGNKKEKEKGYDERYEIGIRLRMFSLYMPYYLICVLFF